MDGQHPVDEMSPLAHFDMCFEKKRQDLHHVFGGDKVDIWFHYTTVASLMGVVTISIIRATNSRASDA